MNWFSPSLRNNVFMKTIEYGPWGDPSLIINHQLSDEYLSASALQICSRVIFTTKFAATPEPDF